MRTNEKSGPSGNRPRWIALSAGGVCVVAAVLVLVLVLPDKPQAEPDPVESMIQVPPDSPADEPEPAVSPQRVRDRGTDRSIRESGPDSQRVNEPTRRPPREKKPDKPDKPKSRRPAGVVDEGIG